MTPQFAHGRRIASKAGHAAVLVFFVTFLAFPFYWMAVTTFKTTQDLHNTENNPYLFNNPPTLRHLSVLFEDTQYLQWLVNTGFVGVMVVLITLLLAVPAGYSLARMTGAWAQTLGMAIFPISCRRRSCSSHSRASSRRWGCRTRCGRSS
jgi:multiple sugar transport system permease protein